MAISREGEIDGGGYGEEKSGRIWRGQPNGPCDVGRRSNRVNEEDLAGRPFVGPAGRVLEKVLQQVGIGRSETYVTNVVKHFSNGSCAASAVFLPNRTRRKFPHAFPHAGPILRAPDDETRRMEVQSFQGDLEKVARAIAKSVVAFGTRTGGGRVHNNDGRQIAIHRF